MLKPFHSFSLISLGIVAACATIPNGDPAVTVTASAETVPVGTVNEDAADDPAIWRNADDPSRSLIVGTDKKAGLHVYNLKGEQLSFMEGAGLNNVDLVEFADGRVLVAASDRKNLEVAAIQFAMLDTATGALKATDRIPVGAGEGYGICMSKPNEEDFLRVFSAPKNGVIYMTSMSLEGEQFFGETSEIARVSSQPEGCVYDDRTGTLYVGEEAAGIWAIDMESGEKTLVAETGTGLLVPDVEGLALAPEESEGGYLVASSQGDNAFAVYQLPSMKPMGRFRIGDGLFGSVEETDGIELDARSFGAEYPGGLFIAQDGVNPPSAQNFKFVHWDEVLEALRAGPTASN